MTSTTTPSATNSSGARLLPAKEWRNWGRSESARPAFLARPTSADEVAAVVRAARERGLTVKVVGAGHSFTAIAATEGVLIDLGGLDGLLAVDAERGRVTLGAGTNLYQLPALLDPLRPRARRTWATSTARRSPARPRPAPTAPAPASADSPPRSSASCS